MPDREITFEIKEHYGTISKFENQWAKELNLISWNGAAAKFDIRDWDEHHERMGKGITLTPWEMRKLVDLYVSRNNEKAVARGKAIESERNARRYGTRKPEPFVPKEKLEVEQGMEAQEGLEDVAEVQTEVNIPEEYDMTANTKLDMGADNEEGLTAEDCNLISREEVADGDSF